MPKEEKVELEGEVVEALPNAMFRVKLDNMVDGVHFRSGQLAASDIGHRALAAALSDLAAMGVSPGEAYLALGLPAGIESEYVLALIGGAQELAEANGVTIAGGDVTRA